jgi:tRNA threonylcarbamoyladenosine biosynthesis protein TsaB
MLLALETSTPQASLALLHDGEILFHTAFRSEKSHNSLIFEPLQAALAAAGDCPLDGIAVGTGPGSYAGVRIGISVALGVSLVKKVPLLGISSFLAIPGHRNYGVVGDARRGQWHFSQVTNQTFRRLPKVGDAAEILAWSRGVMPLLTTDATMPSICEAEMVVPCAQELARRAADFTPEQWQEQSQATPEPYYLAPPFITTPKARPI